MAPWVGCISTVKVMPTPTVETSTGKKITDAEVAAAEDVGGEQHRGEQPEHDLQARGHDAVDQRVDEALEQEGLAEELREVVEADEGRSRTASSASARRTARRRWGTRKRTTKTMAAGR